MKSSFVVCVLCRPAMQIFVINMNILCNAAQMQSDGDLNWVYFRAINMRADKFKWNFNKIRLVHLLHATACVASATFNCLKVKWVV